MIMNSTLFEATKARTIPLSELMRPKVLAELMLPQPDIDRLQKMIESEFPMNILFHGQSGAGKTSAALIIGKSADAHLISESGVDAKLMRKLLGISSTVGNRIFIIEDADLMSKSTQRDLNYLIDERTPWCRFILIAVDQTKLIEPLRSRMLEICVDLPLADRDCIIGKLLVRYEAKLSELGIECDSDRLSKLIMDGFPDLRMIANDIEFSLLNT
jgi:replication-associated recombination protein RarA